MLMAFSRKVVWLPHLFKMGTRKVVPIFFFLKKWTKCSVSNIEKSHFLVSQEKSMPGFWSRDSVQQLNLDEIKKVASTGGGNEVPL